MLYDKVNTDLNFVDREKEVNDFWKKEDIFQKSMKQREGAPYYTFYDGPPTANGKPHIGHVLTRVIKDMIPRYHAMKGQYVPRKAGWDTHGLPVELQVEKELGLNGKEQIEAYGMEPFIQKCKESVWQYKGMWEDFSDTVGFWADMENPYVTYYDDYIESEWWALKKIWDRKLLYKGFKVVPYCPRCGTPLMVTLISWLRHWRKRYSVPLGNMKSLNAVSEPISSTGPMSRSSRERAKRLRSSAKSLIL